MIWGRNFCVGCSRDPCIKLLIELSLVDVGEFLKMLVFFVSQTHRLNRVVSNGRNKSRMRILVASNSVFFVMNAVRAYDD